MSSMTLYVFLSVDRTVSLILDDNIGAMNGEGPAEL